MTNQTTPPPARAEGVAAYQDGDCLITDAVLMALDSAYAPIFRKHLESAGIRLVEIEMQVAVRREWIAKAFAALDEIDGRYGAEKAKQATDLMRELADAADGPALHQRVRAEGDQDE